MGGLEGILGKDPERPTPRTFPFRKRAFHLLLLAHLAKSWTISGSFVSIRIINDELLIYSNVKTKCHLV